MNFRFFLVCLNEKFLFINIAWLVLLTDYTKKLLKGQGTCQSYVYGILNRFQWQRSKADKAEADLLKEATDASQVSLRSKVEKMEDDSRLSKYSSDEEDFTDGKWKLELAWLSKALEPALQLCRWALPTGLFILVRVHLVG